MIFISSDHIKYLKDTLEPDDSYPYAELYEWHNEYLENKKNLLSAFKWKDRYKSLKQDTHFFKNILAINKIIWRHHSVEGFKVEVDVLNIPAEAVNFSICYMWMCPCRFFSFDWRYQSIYPFDVSLYEENAWNIVDSMYDDISKNSLPMLKVEDFLKIVL